MTGCIFLQVDGPITGGLISNMLPYYKFHEYSPGYILSAKIQRRRSCMQQPASKTIGLDSLVGKRANKPFGIVGQVINLLQTRKRESLCGIVISARTEREYKSQVNCIFSRISHEYCNGRRKLMRLVWEKTLAIQSRLNSFPYKSL